MTNLEKAQAWVDSRATEGRIEDADEVLFDWVMEAHNTRRDINEVVSEKYGWVLRSIELKNSDDPFSIMTASELAFAERMCDLKPRVYLEGEALKRLEDMRAVAKAEVDARKERSRIELLKMKRLEDERLKKEPVAVDTRTFDEMFP